MSRLSVDTTDLRLKRAQSGLTVLIMRMYALKKQGSMRSRTPKYDSENTAFISYVGNRTYEGDNLTSVLLQLIKDEGCYATMCHGCGWSMPFSKLREDLPTCPMELECNKCRKSSRYDPNEFVRLPAKTLVTP